jgi:hypothetical protein
MNIVIKTINDKFLITIDSTYTVLQLKEKIEDKIDINKLSQRLLFNGYPLLDNKTINEYNINENSIIHLIKTIY